MTYLYKLGYQCSIPYGENSRYDLIADINHKLIRIQVKTASIKKGNEDTIEFSCRSTCVNTQGNKTKRYTADEIDYFATYWDNQCYLIPVSECSVTKTLRFKYPASGQKEKISLAKDYIAELQISKIKEEVV